MKTTYIKKSPNEGTIVENANNFGLKISNSFKLYGKVNSNSKNRISINMGNRIKNLNLADKYFDNKSIPSKKAIKPRISKQIKK